MPTRIQLPDGSIGEFPDGMSESQIEGVLQKQFGSSSDRPAGLPAGQELPGVPLHPSVDMKEPARVLADSRFGKRLDSNVSGLITPLKHPIKSMLNNAGWSDPSQQTDIISDIRQNPNLKGVSDALADTITAGTIGAATHMAPAVAAPIGEGMKRLGGEIIDRTVGLHAKDVRNGAMPGRAYLEGGGTPALTMEGIAEKSGNIKNTAGIGLRDAYQNASGTGLRIPAADVYSEITKPINELKTLKTSAGGTGITPEMTAFEDSLIPPVSAASLRGGFTPTELFDEMKRPISENTRWNDPTMFDLNKVRQQTVGRIGGMLTDAVPETARLNKIYQGSGNLSSRAQMRADTGQSPLSTIGRRAIEGIGGAALGYATHNPLLGAVPIVADSIPVRTSLGYSLFQGGRGLPLLGAGLKSVTPLTVIARSKGPKPSPQDNENR